MNIDKKSLRQVAGAYATGITVIALNYGDYERADGNVNEKISAMTANSFVSISLDPPLVLVSIDQKSRMFSHLAEGLPLGISILSAEQEEVAGHFAGMNDLAPPPFAFFANGAPWLTDSLAGMATKIEKIIPMGDHHSLLCRVVEIRPSSQDEKAALLFYRGQFRTLS